MVFKDRKLREFEEDLATEEAKLNAKLAERHPFDDLARFLGNAWKTSAFGSTVNRWFRIKPKNGNTPAP